MPVSRNHIRLRPDASVLPSGCADARQGRLSRQVRPHIGRAPSGCCKKFLPAGRRGWRPRHRIRLRPDALRQGSVSLRVTRSRLGPAGGGAPAAEPVQQRAVASGFESAEDLERFSVPRREPQLTEGETQFAC